MLMILVSTLSVTGLLIFSNRQGLASVVYEKSSFKLLGLLLSCKLDWGSYILSNAQAAFKKIEALVCSMNFLSSEVTLYLCEQQVFTCMDYCFMSGLVILFVLGICWISYRNCYVGLFFLHLLHFLNPCAIIKMQPVNLNQLNWFPFFILVQGPVVILNVCMIDHSQILQ